MAGTATFSELARRYVRPTRHALASRGNYLRWLATIPFTSRRGHAALMAGTSTEDLPLWRKSCSEKRVLIVGTGPSLDKAGPEFFESFDTVIYINFALRLASGNGNELFFGTDLGPITEWLNANGDDAYRQLGPERCIFAPVFFDQYPLLTADGLALFSILPCDKASWRTENVRVAKTSLPLVWRYHPRQPEWSTYVLPEPRRELPVMAHTSALSAVLFAAIHGSRDIGLIGCDFSAGRASLAQDSSSAPTAQTFSGAAAELKAMQSALLRAQVNVVNYSWLL